MNRFSINISKSKKAEKLVIRQWFLEKSLNLIIPLILIGIFQFMAIMEFNSNLNNDQPIGVSLVFLILILIIGGFIIYSIFNVYKLKRIKGISRGKNSNLIKKIAKKNEWNISINNQQISIINFSWRDSGTDWGKQLTVLYDEKDILVNCISFGLFSSPSPFHLFANKRKVNKLTAEFQNGIKNVLQQRI